jgi:hypothetical protein
LIDVLLTIPEDKKVVYPFSGIEADVTDVIEEDTRVVLS